MANNFIVADVAGQFQRGREIEAGNQAVSARQQQSQFNVAQQQKLAPVQFQQAQTNLAASQQQLGRDAEVIALEKNVNSALELKSIPDNQKAEFLINKIQSADPSRDMTQSKKALELVQAGRFQELAEGTEQLLSVGQQAGIIKAPSVKPTASQQDFETFKQLNKRAKETGDPTDIQLAKQFGVQSGFDRLTPQEIADIDVSKASKIALSKQAASASKEAFDNLKKVRLTVSNIDDAIKALDKGAATGPIISKLPNFRQASIELNNIKGRMGLDVVGATTFGALSESELAFALDTALPDSLEPAALKEWLIKKKDVQTKLADELRKAASFLGKPGNTISDYIEIQEKKNEEATKKADFTAQTDDELLSF